MNKHSLSGVILILASLPLLAGCVVYRQPRAVEIAPEQSQVIVDAVPPASRVEIVPAAPGPAALWVWVPGRWVWRNHWVWVGGSWQRRPHPHDVWVPGHWGRRHHGYVWIDGHWR